MIPTLKHEELKISEKTVNLNYLNKLTQSDKLKIKLRPQIKEETSLKENKPMNYSLTERKPDEKKGGTKSK